MNTEFETPSQAPVKADRPWTKRVTYKSGKTPPGFAAAATPEQVSAGFSFYDSNAGQKVEMKEWLGFVVATLSGVSGTVPDGTRYINYFSSLVYDTRTDPIKVFMQGADRPIAAGIYKNLRLPAGVNYTQYFICYIPELNELVSIELTAGLQNSVKRAIGNSCGVKPNKVSLFSLCDLSTEFWGIRFSGEFEKRDKEGNEWKTGDMYFMPKLTAGVVNIAKNADLVNLLNEHSDNVRLYCTGYADELAAELNRKPEPGAPKSREEIARTPNAMPVSVPQDFPQVDVTSYDNKPKDDLPF